MDVVDSSQDSSRPRNRTSYRVRTTKGTPTAVPDVLAMAMEQVLNGLHTIKHELGIDNCHPLNLSYARKLDSLFHDAATRLKLDIEIIES